MGNEGNGMQEGLKSLCDNLINEKKTDDITNLNGIDVYLEIAKNSLISYIK